MEVERMRVEICRPQEATPSILQPRIQNSNNVGSLGKRLESIVPTSVDTSTGRTILNIQTHVIDALDETFNTPKNRNIDNFFNTNTIKNIDDLFNTSTANTILTDLDRHIEAHLVVLFL